MLSRILFVLSFAFLIMSCSKKPAQLQEEGMKAYAAGEYAKAQEYFSDGIKKGGTTQLYAGFIAANLVTGKFPQINSAYNSFSDEIRASVTSRYGNVVIRATGIVSELVPFKVSGGNQLPPDYPQTIALQASADYSGYLGLQQQIDNVVRK